MLVKDVLLIVSYQQITTWVALVAAEIVIQKQLMFTSSIYTSFIPYVILNTS